MKCDSNIELCRGADCGSTNLIRAHITPRGFGRDLQGEGPNMSLSAERIRPARPQQGEYDEHILCAECDAKLGRLDEYGLLVSRRFPKEHIALDDKTFELEDFDGSTYSRFVLSVLWRVSISDRPIFKSFSLGKYEGIARDVVFGVCELSDFAAFRVMVGRPRSDYIDAAGFYTLPERTSFAGTWVSYCWALGGFRIIAIVDSRPVPAGYMPLIINRSGILHGMFLTFEKTPEFRAMADSVVAEAIRRGVPPDQLGNRKSRRGA